jgi:hypothetical protein
MSILKDGVDEFARYRAQKLLAKAKRIWPFESPADREIHSHLTAVFIIVAADLAFQGVEPLGAHR